MPGLHIRAAQDSDREAMHAVTQSAYQEYATVMPPPLFEGYRRNILATLDQEGLGERLVAEQDGVIVGSVLLFLAGTTFPSPAGPVKFDWPEVRLLAVSPAMRGEGVGAALMEACVQRARQSGAAALTLHTTEMMQAAMRLYERMGFERAPELDFRPAENLLIKGYRLNLKTKEV